MARTVARPDPALTHDLHPRRVNCPHCGTRMRADYANRRTVATLAGLTRLRLLIRRCHHARCPAYRRPYRPEAEGRFALPRHEFGLDVIALIGRLRYREHRSVPEIRAHLAGRGVGVGAMRRHRDAAGTRGDAVDHFAKVTRSYWPGPFACYGAADLPRANNDPGQAFGGHRYRERRAAGRKGGAPALVLRGPARLVAAMATRQREATASELAGADKPEWRRLRAGLEGRRQRRVDRHRFRRDPEGDLRDLEAKLNQPGWPP